jgi:hypothetical protein
MAQAAYGPGVRSMKMSIGVSVTTVNPWRS